MTGWDSSVGAYTRVEGTPNDPNPDKPFSKIEVKGLFNSDGQLNPSITVIGNVSICIYIIMLYWESSVYVILGVISTCYIGSY